MISTMNNQIESLLIEREGYVRRNLKDRVKAVDASLRELGFEHKYLSEPEVEAAAFEPAVEKATVKRGSKKSS
jgi:hypothetical protein